MLNIGANAAVCDENKPEQLAEQFQVRFSLEDEPSISKADQNGPECVAEKGRVQEDNVEKEVGNVEVLAPKNSVNNVLSWNHQKTESMRWPDNA